MLAIVKGRALTVGVPVEDKEASMTASDRFTERIKCGHCGNSTPMRVAYEMSQVRDREDTDQSIYWSEGDVYQLIVCPACDAPTLRSYYYHEHFEDQPTDFHMLYPQQTATPLGLPPHIALAYQAALKVRPIEPNAYGVLIRRLLAMVCSDRHADGHTLHEKLKSLAAKGEVPAKLVGVANGIKNLGNVAAHPELGELTSAEMPIVDALAKAILEYVYSAPHLAQVAEELVRAKKTKKTKAKKGT
jgi:Domain of unknown function (DUF4145)